MDADSLSISYEPVAIALYLCFPLFDLLTINLADHVNLLLTFDFKPESISHVRSSNTGFDAGASLS